MEGSPHSPVCRFDLVRPGRLVLVRTAILAIALRRMFLVVTLEIAQAPKESLVFKSQQTCLGVGKHYGSVKIDEIAVIRGVALDRTDTVRIMTCRTWHLLLNVLLMMLEALIIQNALVIVALVTQFICIDVFLCSIGCFIPIS